ncbi:MAG: NAD-dependent epimerase/dehydratase family protein, partial [Thermoplasmata archaeon]
RQATVYGISPRMRFDLAINGMVLGIYKNKKLNLMRDGTQLRPFVHVRDTSNAFIYVMNCEPDLVNGQIFNVGSNEENYKLYDLAKGISEKLLGEFRFEWYGSPDTRSYRVNFDKIKRLGYSTKHNAFDSAKEIYDALVSGIVQENPRTNTVGWYKHLLEMNEFLETIKVNGELL